MTKILYHVDILTLCLLLHHLCQTISLSKQSGENTINMTNSNQEIDVRFKTATLLSKTTIKKPVPRLIHHLRKRAIDPNQGSNWLKYVWRERQYKIPQMFLTNIRNLWAVDPAGGRHLFDSGVPYGAVYLVKTLLLDVMFPRIGKNQ